MGPQEALEVARRAAARLFSVHMVCEPSASSGGRAPLIERLIGDGGRIHEIVLNDFTVEEKIDIASKYVLPKICRGMSLDIEKLITFSEGSLKHLVELCEETTGMRTLKTVLIRLLRILNLASISENQLVLNVDEKLVKGDAPYTVTRELLEDIYNFSESEQKSTPGVSNLMMYM